MTILEQMLEGHQVRRGNPGPYTPGRRLAWAPHWDFITISGLIIQIYGQPCIWRSHPRKFSYLKGYDEIRHQVDGECYEPLRLPGQRRYGTSG